VKSALPPDVCNDDQSHGPAREVQCISYTGRICDTIDEPLHVPTPQLMATGVAELSTEIVFVAPMNLISYAQTNN
jgi:hypothetical protein